jgi:hypothetical protein
MTYLPVGSLGLKACESSACHTIKVDLHMSTRAILPSCPVLHTLSTPHILPTLPHYHLCSPLLGFLRSVPRAAFFEVRPFFLLRDPVFPPGELVVFSYLSLWLP